MKKLIALFTLLGLLAVPVSAMAVKAGDWELVGYTKLETYWDSTQVNKNLSGPLARYNAAQPQNMGRWRWTAQSSRFGLKINGPEILGAKTQGYIEMDFDPNQDGRQSASNAYGPRVRHAWFRMDWPGGWQLLMGQYWGVFCDFYPETVNDGPFQTHGQATQRIPQIRLTYKTGPWTFSGLMGAPYDPAGDNTTSYYNNVNTGLLPGSEASSSLGSLMGQRSCMPQFQGQVIYEEDLYGKAAFAGRPRGFVADFGFGVQNIQYLKGAFGTAGHSGLTWGNNNYGQMNANTDVLGQGDTQTLTPWVVQGTLFIPVLVTHDNNLAHTASVTLQAHIGQGFSFFGNGSDADNSFFMFDELNVVGNTTYYNYNRRLTPKYGGYLQGQYYFTNEWYCSVVYGFDKSYGLDRERSAALVGMQGNPLGYRYATLVDQSSMTQELQANLFFTPSKNLKFGLGYSWMQTQYPQYTDTDRLIGTTNAVDTKRSRFGTNHSIRFAGWFFF